MLNRIKNLWELSKLHVEHGEVNDIATGAVIPITRLVPDELGDGKAEFLGEGTEEEWIEQQREDEGSKPWYDRLRRLGATKEMDV